VAAERYHVKRVLHEVERFIERFPSVEIIGADLSLHGPED
jgi:uncharacterized protein YlxP (DUF503 family)